MKKSLFILFIFIFIFIYIVNNRGGGALSGAVGDLPIDFDFGDEGTNSTEGHEEREIKSDGYWVVLHEWSECTLSCGGGKSYLQRMCVPPTNGGKPCNGPAILSKDCNRKPCPEYYQVDKKPLEKSPIIKMSRVSERPQRFELCIIKEGDLNLKVTIAGMPNKPSFPVRVVMNNKTLSIFTSGKFENIYKSFDLKFMKVSYDSEESSKCMEVVDTRDTHKKEVLCIMPTAIKAGESIKAALQEWINDINTFKTKCHSTPEYVPIKNQEIEKKFMQVQMEAAEENMERIREEEAAQEAVSGEKKVDETANLAVNAVQNELKYERLSIQDQRMKEAEEDQKVQDALNNQKSKADCLNKKFENKEKEQMTEELENETAESVNELKQQASLQVLATRSQSLSKMQQMHKISERKRKMKKNQIVEMRTIMSNKLFDENKIGDKEKCNPNKTQEERAKYCNDKLKTRPVVFADCMKNGEEFCYSCCENEFGRFHQDKRDDCYRLCIAYEEIMPQINMGGDKGEWQFVDEKSKIPPESSSKKN